jgi:DNA helicase-2/ATP-dependent DNA helicase PcrA
MESSTYQLNPGQLQAVTATEGPVLIIAGAGTGKTKTLTHRIYHLIHQGVHPHQILAITFTNKAAREMRERVLQLLNHRTYHETPMMKTFHSLGVYVLRRFSREAGLKKDFTILDSNDSMKIVKQAMENRGINPKLYEPRKIRNFISGKKGDGYTADRFMQATHSAFTEIVSVTWKEYELLKHKESAVDFDDLLLLTLQLLEKNAGVRTALQQQWKYIHIDEYQDTNRVQYDIVKILAEQHHNLCVVGDTDQNIYSWRGADLRNILNFEKDYPDAQTIFLEENYRSTKNILIAADEVIKKNTARIHKNLITQQGAGNKINVFTALNERDEAFHIAYRIKDLMQQGVPAQEIVILYRTNFQSRILEEACMQEHIPYQLLGTKFFERKEVKDVVSYIRAAYNRDSLSDIKRIINEPKRGLGPAAIAKIFSGQEITLGPSPAKAYQSFCLLLDRIYGFGEQHPPSELVRFVIEESGFYQLYRTGSEDEQGRLENLEELVTYATRYDELVSETIDEENPLSPLQKMLEDIALQSDQDEIQEHETEQQGKVKLMTIHAAKGLEFDEVFIAGLEQGLFPHDGFDEKKTVEDQEEERRLFYVALTRARKTLHLSHALMRTIYGEQKFNEPSEFITDIPDDIIERESSMGGDALQPIKTVYLDW